MHPSLVFLQVKNPSSLKYPWISEVLITVIGNSCTYLREGLNADKGSCAEEPEALWDSSE